jgi:UDP-3-O-[3-hydroxymyristoyl] glucosamine N-acyltransferase
MIKLRQLIDFLRDNIIQIYGPDEDIEIEGIADLNNSGSKYLDWIHQNSTHSQEKAETSKSKLIISNQDVFYSNTMKSSDKVLIQVKNPYITIAKIGNEFFVRKVKPTIHPTAIIDQGAKIGKDVYIGAYSVIDSCVIGDNSIIQENVIIRDCVKIGNNVLIKSGAIIGNPGFGFVKDEDGKLFKFPQIGKVIIENNVEIGSNTCIDRGAFSNTIIKFGAKISSLCHISHNVLIGSSVIITAHVMISGSTTIGDNVWIAPNSTLIGHQIIGDNVIIGAGSVVLGDIPSDEIWVGNPARFLRKNENGI